VAPAKGSGVSIAISFASKMRDSVGDRTSVGTIDDVAATGTALDGLRVIPPWLRPAALLGRKPFVFDKSMTEAQAQCAFTFSIASR